MDNISVVGIDIAKRYFHLCAGTKSGRVVLRKKLYRSDFLSFISNLPKCTIVMEACGGANFWAREFMKLGFKVKLIAPQFVKPYRKSNKNDASDAEAIMEAALRPTMRFVGVKSLDRQDLQSVHRARELTMKQRTMISNSIRGLLMEYGVILPKGVTQIRKNLVEVLDRQKDKLTSVIRELIRNQYEEFTNLDRRIGVYDKQLEQVANTHPVCKKLMSCPGVGPMTSTALIAHVGDPHMFKRGRDLSAYLGLVPRQNSTGGKSTLGRISKRGDKYLRQLLVHGARSALIAAKNRTDKQSKWVLKLWERRGFNKACVALANKNARILWALMAYDTEYKQLAA